MRNGRERDSERDGRERRLGRARMRVRGGNLHVRNRGEWNYIVQHWCWCAWYMIIHVHHHSCTSSCMYMIIHVDHTWSCYLGQERFHKDMTCHTSSSLSYHKDITCLIFLSSVGVGESSHGNKQTNTMWLKSYKKLGYINSGCSARFWMHA